MVSWLADGDACDGASPPPRTVDRTLDGPRARPTRWTLAASETGASSRSIVLLGLAGELAALGTAVCWTFTALWFTAASRRVGALPVNLLRMPVAFAWLAAWGLVTRGHALPSDASAHAWTWLTASALAGFALGDLCLFRAFVLIGPRLASLVMATAPAFTAVIGWLVLDERLEALAILGIALTVSGLMIAIRERTAAPTTSPAKEVGVRARGLVLALLGALGQALGLVLAKHGMGDYDAFASTQIRVLVGAVAFVAMTTAVRGWPQVRAALRDRTAMLRCALGGTFGPFLGVGLSLYAAQHTAAGIAASLMATQPLLVIPFAVWLQGERAGPRAVVGAAIAVLGVALLLR